MAARYQTDFPWDRLEATALGEGDQVSWEGLKRKGVARPHGLELPTVILRGEHDFFPGALLS